MTHSAALLLAVIWLSIVSVAVFAPAGLAVVAGLGIIVMCLIIVTSWP